MREYIDMDPLENIKQLGYALLPDLVSPSECEMFRQKLLEDVKTYNGLYAANERSSTHGLDDKSGEKVVYNLHNKDVGWFRFFEHPDVLRLLDVLLVEGSYQNADPYYLNNISARCPLIGSKPQQLHIDSRIPGLGRSLVINVLWMLDDFTLVNGGTRVVPSSHRFDSFAPDGEMHKDEVVITGKRGSALVFDAGLWHGGGANTSGDSRWALALGYARWFIKPAYDYMRNTPPDIYDQLNDAQRRLLGFDSVPPVDEFTRVRRLSKFPERPNEYQLPCQSRAGGL